MQKILLKYSGNISQLDWGLYSSENELLLSGEGASLEELNQKINFNQTRTHLLIATPEVVIRTVELPKKTPKTTLERIIPSLLEEDVLSPTEELHFSALQIDKTKFAVMIIEKAKLQFIISSFQNNNILLDSVSPLYMVIPGEQKQVWFNTKYAFVKLNDQFGFCIEKDQFSAFVDDPDIEINAADIWTLLANAKPTQFNLLKRTSSFRRAYGVDKKLKRHLVIAGSFLFVLLGMLFANSLYQMSKENSLIKNQIADIYKTLYPNSTNVVNPRQRIEQELKAGLQQGKGNFFELLHFWGSRFQPGQTNVQLKQFSYRSGRAELTVEASNYTLIDQLVKKLNVKPYKVEQKNTALQEGSAKSIIIISKEGPSS